MPLNEQAESGASALRGDDPSYTESRRASVKCTRELEQLMSDVVKGARHLIAAGDKEPVIRHSPNRCIVQLNGVALTIAWLQNPLAFVADGELLVILWDGNVAPAHPTRGDTAANLPVTRSAQQLWEGVFVVQASDPNSWTWRNRTHPDEALSSTELASQCLTRLGLALDAHTSSAPTGNR